MSKFAERLRETLELRNLSQRGLALKLNVSQKTINHLCLGERYPSFALLIAIAKELDESIDWLVGLVD
ncbi:MAG: helix-turn-helix domain-containing protein [Christensenellaceae bacterium]|jgi:transcriptional regulator with XRE-family HTH domain|nr:helix-turn-helix domain-containing protein [Christensenellaceae bacterium]